MNAAIASTLFLCMMPSIQLPIGFWQVAPANRVTVDGEAVEMKIVKTRAAVIIHGMQLYPIRPEKAAKPHQHDYQMPKSLLVEALATDFDVYALSYAQTITVDGVSVSEGVRSRTSDRSVRWVLMGTTDFSPRHSGRRRSGQKKETCVSGEATRIAAARPRT